jgi:hypothetical protein
MSKRLEAPLLLDASGRVASILRALRGPALVLPSSPTSETTPHRPPLPPSCSSMATTPSSARPAADVAQARQPSFLLQRVVWSLAAPPRTCDDAISSLPCHGGGATRKLLPHRWSKAIQISTHHRA